MKKMIKIVQETTKKVSRTFGSWVQNVITRLNQKGDFILRKEVIHNEELTY